MSIDSALIVRRDTLPKRAELEAAIAETGVVVRFPEGFSLDGEADGFVPITVDGEPTGFEYGAYALHDLDEQDAPTWLRDHGDLMLSFAARRALEAETVSLIQRVLAQRWNASGWIEQELVPPESLASKAAPVEDIDPELAAMMTGTPAERAAAMDAYVAKQYPPVEVNRRADVMTGLKPLIIPAIIVLMFVAVFVWTRLT